MGTKCIAANFAKGETAGPLDVGDTSVNAFDLSGFPSLTEGQHFYATLSGTGESPPEIIKVLTIDIGNAVMTSVARGQDGTTESFWSSNSKLELRNTRAQVLEMQVFMHDSEEDAIAAALEDDFLHYAVDETLC